jgi:multiple sugar transport system permease protein
MMAGYSFARYKIGGFYLPFTILSIRMLPVVAFIIPLFMFSLKLRIIDTHLAIILSHLIICLPFSIWMMRAFFIDIPYQIEEAALVDGCSKLEIFIKIAIPLALPGIAVTGLFCFIFSWSEFIFALVLSRKEAIPVNVRLTGGNNALAVASIIPIFLFSIIINKNIVRGMTLGAIK